MSKARRISDVERTVAMLDLVRGIYPAGGSMSLSHIVVEEVAPGTGFSAAQRWADVLALSVWPSKGLTLDGYEIKASRADLKKEISDLTKHEAVARYCDEWWLVVWDESVLVDGIPESWGIMTTVEGDGERELHVKRRATKRTPEPWPRQFVCSLVRNAYQQSPGAAYVARACASSAKTAYRDGKQIGRNEVSNQIDPLLIALYGKDRWRWPKESRDLGHVLKIAAERLTQEVLDLGGVA